MTYTTRRGLDGFSEDLLGLWRDPLQVLNYGLGCGRGFGVYKFTGRVRDYRDAHNYYIKILLELGFAGLTAFLDILVIAGQMAWRVFRSAKDIFLGRNSCAFFAMLICAAVVNSFEDQLADLHVNGFFWVLLGLVARGLFLVKQEQQIADTRTQEFPTAPASAERVSHA